MRALVLRQGFRDAQQRFAPRGTPAWEALRGVLNELMDEGVPLVRPEDESIALPGVDEISVMTLRRR